MLSRRGLFGMLGVAAAVPFVKMEAVGAAATEGYEWARIDWFNHVRGIGYLVSQSGRRIFVNERVFKAAGIEKLSLTSWYEVAWKVKRSGSVATEVRSSRKWTREESAEMARAWTQERERVPEIRLGAGA
jgi:cold shock CspA family protein